MRDVIALLEGIEELTGRVHGAAQLSDLLQRNALPQVDRAAFVLPLGLRGGRADAATGLYRQPIDRLVGVILVVRSAGDQTGAAGWSKLEPLIEAVIAAIAGTASDDDVGVWTLARGELVSVAAGVLTYQLDFAIEDQLRIAR